MAGFAGVLLDRKPLYPHQADQIDTALTDALGAPKYSSPDGRYRFYTTAPAAQQLDSQLSMEQRNEIGDWVVNPVLPTFEPNYSHGYSFFQTQRPYEPRLVLDNPRTTNVDVQISLDVAYRQGDATFQIHLPHGAILEFPVSAQTQPIQFTMSAPPGVTELPVTISSGPAPQRNVGGDSGPVEVSKLQATDLQLVALLSAIPGLEVTRPPTAERGYN
jgi:hypothetical protein